MPSLSSETARTLVADGTFDIEFHGYLSNHAKHAIIALDRLKAPDSRIKSYWDEYTNETPYGLRLHKVEQKWTDVSPIDDNGWSALRGKKLKWQEQVKFMENELNERFQGDPIKLVQHYAPDLLTGIAGALTHGIIHLGWAIDANSHWMICEGLAYLNFCHIGVDGEKLVRRSDKYLNEKIPIDSFIRVANIFENEHLQSEWIDKVKTKYDISFHPELVAAGFQWQLAKVLHDVHPIATELPIWLDELSLDDLWENMYRTVVWIYLATRDKNDGHGNFLALHLITSLWGLEKVCNILDDEEITRSALGQFYSSSICLLATSGFPSSAVLINVKEDFPCLLSDDPNMDWEEVRQRGIAEVEEHNIKLVYVTQALWSRFGHWHGFSEAAKSFTLTPNIGPKNTSFNA